MQLSQYYFGMQVKNRCSFLHDNHGYDKWASHNVNFQDDVKKENDE